MTTSVPATATIDVSQLSDDDLTSLARECLDEFKNRQVETVVKIRCPACNTHLKNWHEYKPSWSQVRFIFDIMEMLQRTDVPHVHIKSSLKKVPLEHRDHTIVGDITNHYSKMMYLKLLQRCSEGGDSLPQFSFDADEEQEKRNDDTGGVPCFNLPQPSIAFALGRMPLRPAIVRVKNCQIIDVPENRESTMWVRDVYGRDAKKTNDREQDWLERSGKMVIHYPAILQTEEQQELFDDDENGEE